MEVVRGGWILEMFWRGGDGRGTDGLNVGRREEEGRAERKTVLKSLKAV